MTPQEARTARRALAAMFATNGAVMGAWAPQIPLLLPRHGITESVLGLLILALGIGAIAAMLFAGRLIATKGSVPVLKGFTLASLTALPLVVFAPSLWTLAPAMALFGALLGSMDVAMNANAVEVERRLGRAIMSSSHGFWSLGGFVGGITGSWLIAWFGSETQVLVITAAIATMVLIALPFLRGEPPHPKHHDTGPRPALIPRDAGLWLLGTMALFCMVPEGAVLDWAAIYMGKELLAGPFVAGMGFALYSGAMALMRFAGDGVRNRFGAVNTLRVSGLLGAAGMMIAAAAPHPYVALLGFFLSGLGVANMVPIMFSAAGNWPGHAAGAAISTVTMVGYAGILIAPSSIGWLAEHIGFRPTYAGLSLLMLIVTLNAGRAATADNLRSHSPAE